MTAMNTWTKESVPTLPTPTVFGRIVGSLRLSCLLGITIPAVAMFLIGRALRSILGRRVVFHFGLARMWARGCLWLTGLKLRLTGSPIKNGALVANHSSWLDILALRAATLIYFVSKAEVANWPGVGFITKITGTVFIERRRTEVKRQEAVLRSRIAQDQLLCLFPEGTSTDGLRVLPFKTSLFSTFFVDGEGTDIQVQPVAVRYHVNPRSEYPADFYGWWGTMGFERHIWDVLTLSFRGAVDVVFLPPLKASEFADRKAMAEARQNAVSSAFDKLAKVSSVENAMTVESSGETI